MGLLTEGINEVIATTRFNAAPIGIHFREGKAGLVLFIGSHTADNIERDGWIVANLIHDPVLYVKTAFDDLSRESFVEEPVGGKKMQRLAGAGAWAAFTTTIERKTNEALMVRLSLEKEIIEEVFPCPVNRGFNSIVEMAVHATRYKKNRDPELKKMIDYHAGIVRKCGGRQELAAMDLLMKYLA